MLRQHQQAFSGAYIELADQSGLPRMVETKVDLASKMMRTTSISCTGEPQKLAVEALKDGDMQTFTDVLNTEAVEAGKEDPDFWVNSGRKEDEGLNLGELAVVQDSALAISTMARLEIPLDLVNPITGYSALHRAAELGKPDLLAQILKTGRQDFDVNSKTSRRKRGLTALYLAAAQPSKEHLACMDLLLASPLIDVNLKDVSLTTTALYAAGKAKNREGVVKLLEQGANPDIVVLVDSGKTIRDFVSIWLPDLMLTV